MKRYLIIIFLMLFCSNSFAQTYIDYYRQSIDAYKAENWTDFLELTKKADSLRPNHRSILYNLAIAFTVNEKPEEAVQTLMHRSDFYADGGVLNDPEFETLHTFKSWSDFEEKVLGYNQVVDHSELSFTIELEGFHPEGIAYSKTEDRFYFTDIRNGLVYSSSKEGKGMRTEIDLKEYGYWSAAGINITEDKLWVTTVAFENFSGYEPQLEGRSAVLCFNLLSKKLEKAFEIEGEHAFGDLTVTQNGTVYVTDSSYPMVYRISDQDTALQAFISSSRWYNLQGIAISDNAEYLYISDYITGIHQVNISNGEMKPLIEDNHLLRGADGIYQKNGSLILLQNGTLPVRVGKVKLDDTGLGDPESLTYEVQATIGLTEPTLGVWVGSDLYYIGNSPWQYYEEGKPLIETWPEIRVYKISAK